MLFAWVGVSLVFEGAEGGDDTRASFSGFDDRVNVAAFGSHEGIGEAVPELGDFFLAQFFAQDFHRNRSVIRMLGTEDG